ncbi:unnamed protein product [Effrenium voratum]|uniref:Uncharacterized protein n=1 Tax=Effrenium voratum TaxID=2562239 RepID=A0AA36J004_9DINO|nr:unnamed protein product [Effrenium voratum]CAJ1441740.1 unnamed protein product [Effrenium voratum]
MAMRWLMMLPFTAGLPVGPLPMPMVQQIRFKQSPYFFVPAQLLLNASFRNSWQCEEQPEPFFCDVGLGFSAGRGWRCDGRSFDHTMDADTEGIFFDRDLQCNGTVSWEAALPSNGLHFVEIFLDVLPEQYSQGGCWLNSYQMTVSNPRAQQRLRFRGLFQVLVADRRVMLSGTSLACGRLLALAVTKVNPWVANIKCWDFKQYEYHSCCTVHDASQSFDCFDRLNTFERCCRTPTADLASAVSSLFGARPTEARSHCVFPHCQRRCLGAGRGFYAEPRWVAAAPYPKPLRCENMSLYPLTYSVPGELVVECLPVKSHDFALAWPGDTTTYVFSQLDDAVAISEYFRMYQEAMFAVTTRKSGNDAGRHVEILASGCVPVMPDVGETFNHSLAHHNKELLAKVLRLPGLGVGILDVENFDGEAYLQLAQDLLLWTRHRLTTAAMAEYFLSVLGYNSSSEREHLQFLFLVPEQQSHMPVSSFMLLHGLREILGPERLVDYPLKQSVYEPAPGRLAGASRGPRHPFMLARWRLPWVSLNREKRQLEKQLSEQYFSHVVYAFLQPSDLDAAVLRFVPKERLIGVKGYDHMPTQLLSWARRMGTMFGYNLEDSCEAGPDSDPFAT